MVSEKIFILNQTPELGFVDGKGILLINLLDVIIFSRYFSQWKQGLYSLFLKKKCYNNKYILKSTKHVWGAKEDQEL